MFNIDEKIKKLAIQAQNLASAYLQKADEAAEYNQQKMLLAFQNAGVSESHFAASTGYGYDDRGRDVLDRIYKTVLGAEDALVRHNFVSGTHALTVALFGVLRPGDTMLCVTGTPYDTLLGVIGLAGKSSGSLKDFNINYSQVDLTHDGKPDIDAIREAVNPDTKMVYIQ